MEELHLQPRQSSEILGGKRVVLHSHDFLRQHRSPQDYRYSENIAKKNAAELLRAVNNGYDFLCYGKIWQWPAVELMLEECKLRVGGMSVTELRQQLENYWGQGGILGDGVKEGCKDMWASKGADSCFTVWDYRMASDNTRQVLNGYPKKYPGLSPTVLSHWVNRECAQWLSYFIANNHTLGAVYAWFAAFLGVTRGSLYELVESFRNIWVQYRTNWAFMESIHLVKTRMSFDVCIEGHDEGVDGLPSLPSNTMITTNKKGMQVIHNSIDKMFPRRIWDICANTVIPAMWFCGPPCPLTGSQEMGDLGVKPISHAWAANEDRRPILTEANQQMWPVPLPKGVLLEDVRGEMIRLGVCYAWLDVLCLRQRAQPTFATDLAIPANREEVMERITPSTGEVVESIPLSTQEVVERREQRRLEEWKVDVPTIGAIYSNLAENGLYRGGPIVIFMSGLGRPFRDEGWDSERHWLRRAWTLQETPDLSKCLIAGLPGGHEYGHWDNRESWPWTCKV